MRDRRITATRLDVVGLEEHGVRQTNREVGEDGERPVGLDAAESEVVGDLMDCEEEVLICRRADDVRREEEGPGCRMRVTERVRSTDLQRDDGQDDVFRERLASHELVNLRMSREDGLATRSVRFLGHCPGKVDLGRRPRLAASIFDDLRLVLLQLWRPWRGRLVARLAARSRTKGLRAGQERPISAVLRPQRREERHAEQLPNRSNSRRAWNSAARAHSDRASEQQHVTVIFTVRRVTWAASTGSERRAL